MGCNNTVGFKVQRSGGVGLKLQNLEFGRLEARTGVRGVEWLNNISESPDHSQIASYYPKSSYYAASSSPAPVRRQTSAATASQASLPEPASVSLSDETPHGSVKAPFSAAAASLLHVRMLCLSTPKGRCSFGMFYLSFLGHQTYNIGA